MAYRVAICDDSFTDAEYVKKLLFDWAKSRKVEVYSKTFNSAENFIFYYEDDKLWDILLLDIEMTGMDGVTLAKKIRKENEIVQIVFITGYSDYIAEGYEVEALHYLMKPLKEDKFYMVLDRALEKQKQNERCLNIEYYGEMIRIPFYEIRYFDVQHNYVTIHAKKDYTIKHSLTDFENKLDQRFVRVGRSLIVNLKYIEMVTKTEVHLASKEILPLPRGAYETLNRAIIERT